MADPRANNGFGGNGGGAFFNAGDEASCCGLALGSLITLLNGSSDSGIDSYSSAENLKLPLRGRRRLSGAEVAIPENVEATPN